MNRSALLMLVTLAATAACQVEGDLAGQFRCRGAPDCPAGYQCIAALCVGAEPGVTACATPELLTTTFDDPSWIAHHMSLPFGSVATIVDGALTLSAPSASQTRAIMVAFGSYDLRGRAITVEIDSLSSASSWLVASDPTGISLFLGVDGGALIAGTDTFDLARRPYDSAKDRWWRLREQDGWLLWETSPDGAAWALLAKDRGLVDPAWLTLWLDTDSGSAGSFRLASMNLDGPAADPAPDLARWCAARTWRDNFGDGDFRPEATTYAENCEFTEIAGAVQLRMRGGGAYCEHRTTRPVDAREGTFTLEAVPAPAPATTAWSLVSPDGRAVVAIDAGSRLGFRVEVNGAHVFGAASPRDQAAQRFWRITFAGASVSFATSPDGVSWDLQAATTVPALDASAMFVVRTSASDLATPVTAQFGELRW